MTEKSESRTPPESYENLVASPQHGWIFDADGVLLDINSIEVERPTIADFLFAKLQKGEPVAVNTGRGVHFALDKILPELQARGVTDEMLEKFMVVGEKGAVMAYFKAGDLHVDVDETISVPNALREHIENIVATEFKKTMFQGMEHKASMLSPEKRGDVPLNEKYLADQNKLVARLEATLREFGLEEDYRVDKTKIAVDVQHIRVGKHLGAEKILDQWREKGLLPKISQKTLDEDSKVEEAELITTWGDSGSDIEMAEEVYRQGISVRHIDVSQKDEFEGGEYKGRKLPFPITRPGGYFLEGTENYMNLLKSRESTL